jgi:hypothetical protein
MYYLIYKGIAKLSKVSQNQPLMVFCISSVINSENRNMLYLNYSGIALSKKVSQNQLTRKESMV